MRVNYPMSQKFEGYNCPVCDTHLPPAQLAVDEHDVQMRCNCDYYFDDDGKLVIREEE